LVHCEIKAQFVAVKNVLARINPKFPLPTRPCSVEKIKEWVMRLFDDASLRRLFNWGRAAALALPDHIMAG
jgi:hypothetical protein